MAQAIKSKFFFPERADIFEALRYEHISIPSGSSLVDATYYDEDFEKRFLTIEDLLRFLSTIDYVSSVGSLVVVNTIVDNPERSEG
jgi:hypothetical protein